MMRWPLCGVALLELACGGAQSKPVEVEIDRRAAEYCPESYSAPMPALSPVAEWWAEPRTACPKGAVLRGSPPPAGEEVWCARADGTRHGRWTWWYGNGKMVSDGHLNASGEPHGPWIAWHKNGRRKMQGSYTEGKKHGRWIMWHANGELATDMRFHHGEQHGPWTWWYPSGTKAGEGEFVSERPHGRWTRCAENGLITKVELYRDDRLIDWIDYEDGRRVGQYD